MPYVTRRVPVYDVMSAEGLELIEHNAETILEEVGVEFRDDPEALALWRRAGADVGGERVRIPRGLARKLVTDSAPAEFVQHARNLERSTRIGGPHMVFAPAYGPPFIRSLDEGRRYATIEDFRNFVKLTYLSPGLHHAGGTLCEPVDLPVNKRHLDMVHSHLGYSDKPFMGSVTAPERAEDTVSMAKIVFGVACQLTIGRIYEYFLTRFADQKAHDGGEFFTPVSLVSLIAHVLDPERGTVLDPACGSGGMFVQSARTVEEHGRNPTERLTFRGLEKNATTIRLARMNLAVHGLEGDIKQAITYYEDPHELLGRADYVMANPPFNVDEIDAGKVGAAPRLPFGLPGVNRKGKVGNGNYVWISYFYSYLNERGRAGFVMSSQASSAGGSEAGLRRRLVETGDVDVMIAIRSNFFYTRTVPCELWFLDRAKPKKHRGKVLMIDARNVYRKVTRKICDFSPEQQRNLLAIVWLYRGEAARFLELVSGYLWDVVAESQACFGEESEEGDTHRPLPEFLEALAILFKVLTPCLKTLPWSSSGARRPPSCTAWPPPTPPARSSSPSAAWSKTPCADTSRRTGATNWTSPPSPG